MRAALLSMLLSMGTGLPNGSPNGLPNGLPTDEGGKPADEPWGRLDGATFARARRESKLVLLSLAPLWCPDDARMRAGAWAHPAVQACIALHFVAVREDAAARPDLVARYGDGEWPLTVVVGADGHDVLCRAGVLGPEALLRLLHAVREDPTPEPAARPRTVLPALRPGLPEGLREALRERHAAAFDPALGGPLAVRMRLDAHAVELALRGAAAGDANDAALARRTLDALRGLEDPVWGGFYRDSLHGDWAHPRREKPADVQAACLRCYAQAYAVWGRPRDLRSARAIVRYVDAFLTAREGTFHAAQAAGPREHADAYFLLDDAGRRALGVPAVDTRVLPHANGALAEALLTLHAVCGDDALLVRARRAVEGVRARLRRPDGGYRRGDDTRPGHDTRPGREGGAGARYLADDLAMARAALRLHAATRAREWLQEAVALADVMLRAFAAPDAGLLPVAEPRGFAQVRPDVAENVSFARFALALHRVTGAPAHRAAAAVALRYLGAEAVALGRGAVSGVLLADAEFRATRAAERAPGRPAPVLAHA